MHDTHEPRASRPHTQADYGIPSDAADLLPWSFVTDRLAEARNYWLATVRPDGRPHTMPVWGVWVAGTLYFGGGRETIKARNLARNPAVAVHLEDAEEVVIIEGTAEEVLDETLQGRIDDAYEAKYGIRHGTPVWGVRMRKVFAWQAYPITATRWEFPDT